MGMDLVWMAAVALLWAMMVGLVLAFEKLAPRAGARP